MLVALMWFLQLTGVDDELGEEEPLGELDASKQKYYYHRYRDDIHTGIITNHCVKLW